MHSPFQDYCGNYHQNSDTEKTRITTDETKPLVYRTPTIRHKNASVRKLIKQKATESHTQRGKITATTFGEFTLFHLILFKPNGCRGSISYISAVIQLFWSSSMTSCAVLHLKTSLTTSQFDQELKFKLSNSTEMIQFRRSVPVNNKHKWSVPYDGHSFLTIVDV